MPPPPPVPEENQQGPPAPGPSGCRQPPRATNPSPRAAMCFVSPAWPPSQALPPGEPQSPPERGQALPPLAEPPREERWPHACGRAEQSRATCPRQAAAWRCAPAHLPHTNGPAGRSWPRPAFKPTEASIRDQLLTSHQRAGVQPRTVPSRHVKKIRACSQLVSTKGKRPRCQAGGVPVPGRARYFQPHPTSPPV